MNAVAEERAQGALNVHSAGMQSLFKPINT